VVPSAQRLAETVIGLATKLTEVERDAGSTAVEVIDKEIAMLESQANPLEGAASEMRVKRLAMLKRNRRTASEGTRRRSELKARLENCTLALQNMKFDVLRLKTGNESWQRVTSVAEAAMALAREVDSAIYVGDELARLQRPATRG
jgi:serine/threonine-protein kinase